jgi:hypothetical protein
MSPRGKGDEAFRFPCDFHDLQSRQHLKPSELDLNMQSSHLWRIGLLLATFALPFPVKANVIKNPQLVAQLKAAGTQLDRLKLLPNDKTDWTFDFTAQDGYTFEPASVINANTASWSVCLAFVPVLTRKFLSSAFCHSDVPN